MNGRSNNGKVRVSVGIPSNGPKDWTVTLRAEDSASGELLFEMDIAPADWVQICRGLMFNGDAFIGRHLDRVGKELQVESVMIPREVMDRAGCQRDEMASVATEWANQHCSGPDAPWFEEGGPEQWEVRHQNNGWKVIVRRWTERAS